MTKLATGIAVDTALAKMFEKRLTESCSSLGTMRRLATEVAVSKDHKVYFMKEHGWFQDGWFQDGYYIVEHVLKKDVHKTFPVTR